MSATIEKDVQGLISSIGYLERDGVYYREPDCFQNVRDLVRYLSRDDKKATVRRICSTHNIVKNDLVPLMRIKDIDPDLFDLVLRFAVNLCQPTMVVLRGNVPDDHEAWQIFYEVETGLVNALPAFADPEIFRIFDRKIKEHFDKEWEYRTEKERLVVERILVIIRYIFSIGIEGGKYKAVPEVNNVTREKVISGFFTSGISDVLLEVSVNPMEREFCFHILTAFSQILRKFDASIIASDKKEFNLEAKIKLEKEQARVIQAMRVEDAVNHRANRRCFLSGSFVVRGIKALNPDNNFVVSGALVSNENNPNPIERLSKRKRPKGVAKNRRVENLEEVIEMENTADEIDPTLIQNIKEFSFKILEGRYNKLMRITKDLAFSGGRSVKDDKYNEIYFFSFASFMMEFTRVSKRSCREVSQTFSIEFYHQITSYLTTTFELMKTEKTNIRIYALRAQHAITVYREIVLMLFALSKSNFPEEKELFKKFCTHIFEVEEYRELSRSILVRLTPASTTKKMLRDLIIANHYYLYIMEKVVEQGELLKVRKAKLIRKAKNKKAKERNEHLKELSDVKKLKEPLINVWSNISEELSDVLLGTISEAEDISPVDALLDVDDEKFQIFAVLRIQVALRKRNVCDGVGIYRAARVLWPEIDVFGNDDMSPDDEMLELHEIFFKDLNDVSEEYEKLCKNVYGGSLIVDQEEDVDGGEMIENEKQANIDEYGEMEYDELDEDTSDAKYAIVEISFDFEDFVMSCFGKPDVIKWYVHLFKEFQSNSPEVNKAILKFFHRIAFQFKSPAMLYQASLFDIFRTIGSLVMKYPKESRKDHKYYELYEFGYYLLDKFFAHYKQNGSGLICDLLFWKNDRDAAEIEEGCGKI